MRQREQLVLAAGGATLDYAVQPEQVTYQPAGGRALLRDTQARQRGLGHEDQPATRPQQPGRFGNPLVRVAPDPRTVLADHQVSAPSTQRHPLGICLNQRKAQAKLALQAARDGQLPGRNVHPGRPRARAGPATPRRTRCRSPAPPPPRQPGQPAWTGNRGWGMHHIPRYGSADTHLERAYRSNQADMCSSHNRRVTAT